jgi:DNA primase
LQAKKLKILRDVLGEYRRERKEFLFYCPKCDHHKPKLSVNLSNGCFKCWVCDYSGRKIRSLVRKHGSYLDYKAWGEFEEQVDISEFDLLFDPFNEIEREERLELPAEFVSLVNKNLPLSSLAARQYLRDRGITKLDICRWKIGFCGKGEYEGYVVIPSFNLEGNINFFVARSYNGDWKKYKNPKVSRNTIIFDELFLNFQEDLIVVEGVFDAIVAGHNTVPLLGSTLSEKSKLMHEIIKNDTTVYLALDFDAERKSMKIINKLLEYGVEVYKIDTSGVDDVGEMYREEFLKRKRNATLMTEEVCLFHQAMSV